MEHKMFFLAILTAFFIGCSDKPVVFTKGRSAYLKIYPAKKKGDTTKYYFVSYPDTAEISDAGTDQKFDSDEDRVKLLSSSPVIVITGNGKVLLGKKDLAVLPEPHIKKWVSENKEKAAEIFQKCTNF